MTMDGMEIYQTVLNEYMNCNSGELSLNLKRIYNCLWINVDEEHSHS